MEYTNPIESIQNPFLNHVNTGTFYVYPALSQRLGMINNLFAGESRLILVLGEAGSGKTLLMKQFLAREEDHWKSCRINAHDPTDMPSDEKLQNMVDHRAYMYMNRNFPVIMMDDAHGLTEDELAFLLRLTGVNGFHRQVDKLVLFAEPSILCTLSALSGMIAEAGAIEKIFMPRLSFPETQDYVAKRLLAGHMDADALFSRSDMEWIHQDSGGSPGGINQAAARLYQQKTRNGIGFKRLFKQIITGITGSIS